MKLDNKKRLAAKALNVGKGRIIFDENRLDEIKEAITKRDIKDLLSAKAIRIREVKGRKAHKSRKTKKGAGKIKIIVHRRKQEYVKITRKLRAYARFLKESEKISQEEYLDIRKKIRARYFKSKAQLKEYTKKE